MKRRPIDAEELDILRELSNIGAGHAVTSLASLLGQRRVSLRVPRVEALPKDDLAKLVGGPSVPVVGISFELFGKLAGDVLILFRSSDAVQVSSLVTGEFCDPMSEINRSALEELGNILASSYLNALSQMLGGTLLPSIPRFASGAARDVIDGAHAPTEGDALVLVNEFMVEGVEFVGHFLLFLGPESLDACLEAAKGWS
jgi:chemotaxis protein CheC